jgi:hypothetical protein
MGRNAASRATPASRSAECIATDKNWRQDKNIITFIFEDIFPQYIYRRKLQNSEIKYKKYIGSCLVFLTCSQKYLTASVV